MKKMILLAIVPFLLLNSCAKSSCEPKTIAWLEDIYIELLNQSDENVFNVDFSTENLIIKENNNSKTFTYTPEKYIKFKLDKAFYEQLRELNKECKTEVLFLFSKEVIDTLKVYASAVVYPGDCGGSGFKKVSVYYNSNLLYTAYDQSYLFNTTETKPLIIKR